jgi:hypothetical protein
MEEGIKEKKEKERRNGGRKRGREGGNKLPI